MASAVQRSAADQMLRTDQIEEECETARSIGAKTTLASALGVFSDVLGAMKMQKAQFGVFADRQKAQHAAANRLLLDRTTQLLGVVGG